MSNNLALCLYGFRSAFQCLSVCQSVCLSECLSVCLSVSLSVCFSVCQCMCLSKGKGPVGVFGCHRRGSNHVRNLVAWPQNPDKCHFSSRRKHARERETAN